VDVVFEQRISDVFQCRIMSPKNSLASSRLANPEWFDMSPPKTSGKYSLGITVSGLRPELRRTHPVAPGSSLCHPAVFEKVSKAVQLGVVQGLAGGQIFHGNSAALGNHLPHEAISRWHRQTDGNTPFASSVEATPIVSDDLSHADTMATGEIRYSSDRGSP